MDVLEAQRTSRDLRQVALASYTPLNEVMGAEMSVTHPPMGASLRASRGARAYPPFHAWDWR